MTTLEAIQRLQWKHEFSSTFEGRICPHCGQLPLESYIKGPRSRYKKAKKWFGHLPNCWIGKSVAQAEKEDAVITAAKNFSSVRGKRTILAEDLDAAVDGLTK